MHPLHAAQSRAAHSHHRASTSATYLRLLPLPPRKSLITSPEYWTQEAAAYRCWRHQISVSPTWFKSPLFNEEGKEVTGLKALVMEVEREYKAAKEVAEAFGSALPGREMLVDDEGYWDVEAEAWKVWREGVEDEWVKEGELRASMYMGGTPGSE
ncbi:hypothetical protein MMC14_008919 [Varicellaria rhodocarpa]|nr:hypothetical protein [Varicellaria rhodocarpa]